MIYSFDPDADMREQLDMREDVYCHTCGLSVDGKARIESFGFKVTPCCDCKGDYDEAT